MRPTTKAFTNWLNKVTGGNETEAGMIDVNPENIDHYIDFLGGGVGKFINNSITTGEKLLSEGDFPDLINIPVARQFLGEPVKSSIMGKIYDVWEESSRTLFSEKEQGGFIKNITKAIVDGRIDKDVGKKLIITFAKGQLILQLKRQEKK